MTYIGTIWQLKMKTERVMAFATGFIILPNFKLLHPKLFSYHFIIPTSVGFLRSDLLILSKVQTKAKKTNQCVMKVTMDCLKVIIAANL